MKNMSGDLVVGRPIPAGVLLLQMRRLVAQHGKRAQTQKKCMDILSGIPSKEKVMLDMAPTIGERGLAVYLIVHRSDGTSVACV